MIALQFRLMATVLATQVTMVTMRTRLICLFRPRTEILYGRFKFAPLN